MREKFIKLARAHACKLYKAGRDDFVAKFVASLEEVIEESGNEVAEITPYDLKEMLLSCSSEIDREEASEDL